MRHDRRIDRSKAAEVAHPGDVLDGVRLPGEPLACAPPILLARAFEFAGGARQIIEDHVRLHDRKPAMAQRRHQAVAVDREVVGRLLGAGLEVHGLERMGDARQRQEQHRLVARARREAAVDREAVVHGHLRCGE